MKNILLILFLPFIISINVNGQSLKSAKLDRDCDTALYLSKSQKYVLTTAPIMPQFNLTKNELENVLNSSITIPQSSQYENSKFFITLRIDCQGNAFDYQINRTNDTLICTEIVNVLKSQLKWTSARVWTYDKQKSKPVICAYNLGFVIKNGRLELSTQ